MIVFFAGKDGDLSSLHDFVDGIADTICDIQVTIGSDGNGFQRAVLIVPSGVTLRTAA
jgi:hypothetical protein